jgi:hypothetical protein
VWIWVWNIEVPLGYPDKGNLRYLEHLNLGFRGKDCVGAVDLEAKVASML